MAPEFSPGLNIRDITRSDADIDNWQRHALIPDLRNLPITNVLIGVTLDKKFNYYPIDIDLLKKGPKNIFIEGGGDGFGKEELLVGILRRASDTIAQGHLEMDIITTYDDPAKLTTSLFLERHMRTANYTKCPEGQVAGKMINRVLEKVHSKSDKQEKRDKAKIFAIDDLGFVVKKSGANRKFRAIFESPNRNSLLTIATINESDKDFLASIGISKEKTPGIWIKEDERVDNIFYAWNKRKKRYSSAAILPFTFGRGIQYQEVSTRF